MMTIAVSCATSMRPADVSALAARYVELTRELARHDPSLVDHWLVEPPPLNGPRQPVQPLAAAVATLSAEVDAALVAAGPDTSRLTHLAGQLRALDLAARRLLGASPSFDDEALAGLGLTTRRADADAAARARRQLDEELPGDAPLAERVQAFKARFVVPAERGDHVMRLALETCRAAVASALPPLPPDEAVEVRFAAALPWDAYARYLGAYRTRLTVNGGRPLDLTRTLRLACHEGYPGHHLQYVWTADQLIAARGWTEFALVPGFGPDLLLAEGAAEAGTDLAMPPPRRERAYREVLAPAAGLSGTDLDRLVRVEEALAVLEPLIGDIARDYLDDRVTAAVAAERLTTEALVADAESFIPFIEQRRTRLLAYAEGRRVALARLATAGLAGLPALFIPPPAASTAAR